MDKIPIDTIEDVLIKAKVRYDSILSVVKDSIKEYIEFDFFIDYRHNQYMVCTNALLQVPLTDVINYIKVGHFFTYLEFKNLFELWLTKDQGYYTS